MPCSPKTYALLDAYLILSSTLKNNGCVQPPGIPFPDTSTHSREAGQQLALLMLLKSHQYLKYLPTFNAVPLQSRNYIGQQLKVREAVYVLDGLLKNQSVLQPDTLYADTHGQAEPVFSLAALLGIKLMPRMRTWNGVTFYCADWGTSYKHIDALQWSTGM